MKGFDLDFGLCDTIDQLHEADMITELTWHEMLDDIDFLSGTYNEDATFGYLCPTRDDMNQLKTPHFHDIWDEARGMCALWLATVPDEVLQ